MKRLTLFIVLVLLCASLTVAWAQTVYYKTQATLLWDAVTTDSAGDPILPTDTVTYEVFIYDNVLGAADPQDTSQIVSVGSTANTEYLITFPYRTRWVAGVRTKLTDEAGNFDYSLISYSDVPIHTGPSGPFMYVPLPMVPNPLGLRDAGM